MTDASSTKKLMKFGVILHNIYYRNQNISIMRPGIFSDLAHTNNEAANKLLAASFKIYSIRIDLQTTSW